MSKQTSPLLMTFGLHRLANLVPTNCNQEMSMGKLTTLQVMENMASGIPMDNGTLENPRGKAQ